MRTTSRRRLAAVMMTAVMGTSISIPANAQSSADLPFGVPQVYEPTTGLTSGAAITYHDGAPVPQAFTADYLTGYISDVSSYDFGVYIDVVDGFDDLRNNHPDVMQRNLDIVVDYNTTSSPERIASAQLDALADEDGVLLAVSNALGAEGGQALRDALAEHRLPKTEFLMGNGYAARAGGPASATWVEKEVFNYPRPFVVAPDRIVTHQTSARELYDADSPSYPSGHTNQATWTTTLLALMIPELGPQILARGSESGESRLVMGVHYPLDVMGGRMMGTAAAADRWNDPKMRDAIIQAGAELRAELEWRTGKSIAELVATDTPYATDEAAVGAYTQRMNYGFAPVYDQAAPMIVPAQAVDLLLAAHPDLTWGQRYEVLRQTASPAGSPLDDQSAEGSWQRLNLAAAWNANVTVNADGSVSVG